VIEAVEIKETLQSLSFFVGPELTHPIGPVELTRRVVSVELFNGSQFTCAARQAKAQDVVQIN